MDKKSPAVFRLVAEGCRPSQKSASWALLFWGIFLWESHFMASLFCENVVCYCSIMGQTLQLEDLCMSEKVMRRLAKPMLFTAAFIL